MSTCLAASSHRFSSFLCTGFLATLFALAGSGCKEKPPEPVQSPGPPPGATAEETPSDRCQDYANSIRDTFVIDRLGASTDLNQGVSLLNQWQRLCQAVSGESFPLPPETAGAFRDQLSPAQGTLLQRSLFVLRDGEHVRNCTLWKAIQSHAVGTARGDLERAFNLFQHLVRNVELIEQHPDDVPLSMYEVCLLGRGTAEDRAWLFVELLRQLRIDAVVLTLNEDKEREVQPLLVGVLLTEGVFLFDPRLGMPLPAQENAAADPANVTTLEGISNDPSILAALAADSAHPYPLAADDVSKLVPHLVGNTSLWSPRMEAVQEIFTGDRATVVFERPVGSPGKPGLFDRVAHAPHAGWKPGAVRIWPYPERQLQGYGNMNALHQQTLTRLVDSWQAPSVLETTGEGRLVLRPTRGQWTARVYQLMGRYEEAVKEFTKVQLRSQFPPQLPIDARTRLIHQKAGADATYWMGVCKFEQGRPADRRIALDKFQHYLQTHPGGPWAPSCHYLIACDQAARQEYSAAVAELQKVPVEHPQHAGFEYLIRVWQTAAMP